MEKEREGLLILPATFPNMAGSNGAGGIGPLVLATNIRRTILERIDRLTCAGVEIENPDLTSEKELIEIYSRPATFPYHGKDLLRPVPGARKAYLEGRGSVIMRAKTRVDRKLARTGCHLIDENLLIQSSTNPPMNRKDPA